MLLFFGLFIITVSLMILFLNTPKSMLFICVLLALFAWDKAKAAPQIRQQLSGTVLGLGNAFCTDYTKDYKLNTEMTKMVYFTWFAGFATGLNTLLPDENKKNVAAKTVEKITKELLVYCLEHPLQYFTIASANIFSDLPVTGARKPLTGFD